MSISCKNQEIKLIPNPQLEKVFNREFLQNLADLILIRNSQKSVYIDFKSSYAHNPHKISVWLSIIIKEMFDHLYPIDIFVASKGFSGIILTTMLSTCFPHIHPLFINSSVKNHDIVQKVIGNLERARQCKVFIVDDVVATGKTIKEIKKELEKEGIKAEKAIVVVKRNPIDFIDGLKVEEIFRIY